MWERYLKIPEFLRISGKDVEKVLLSLNLPKNSKVLDVGCGYGRISLFLKSKGHRVIAVDVEDKMVKEAREKGIDARKMDAKNLRFNKNSFELVVTDGLFEHFKNPEEILREEARVSKKFVVNFIPKTTWWNKILELIQGTPEVYWRSKNYWLRLHRKYFKKVKIYELKRLWAFICTK